MLCPLRVTNVCVHRTHRSLQHLDSWYTHRKCFLRKFRSRNSSMPVSFACFWKVANALMHLLGITPGLPCSRRFRGEAHGPHLLLRRVHAALTNYMLRRYITFQRIAYVALLSARFYERTWAAPMRGNLGLNHNEIIRMESI